MVEGSKAEGSKSEGGRICLNVDARAQSPTFTLQGGASVTFNTAAEEFVVPVVPEGGPAEGISFDDALTKYVGEFGKGQVAVYFFASLLQIPNAVLILLMVFSVGSPVTDKSWVCNSTATEDPACMAVWSNPDPAAVQAGFCSLNPSQWQWSNPGEKLVSRFNLVCADAWKSQLANSFFFLGYLIGSGVFGGIADAYGRKGMSFAATSMGAVFTAAALGATNYWVLLVLRLLTGIGVAGQALGAFMLATEMIGPTYRGMAGIITQVFFIVGEFVLVIFAVSLSSWRGQFTAGAVLCAASLAVWPLVPESGRWLYVQGRGQEALQVLSVIARRNGSRMPSEPLAGIPAANSSSGSSAGPADASNSNSNTGNNPNKLSLLAALRSNGHIARRFFILAYAWMVMCMVYYGISFGLGGLGSSLVMSFSIAAVAELPSYLLSAWAIEHWGRHNVMAGGMLLGGAACIACALTPSSAGRAGLAAVGKFGISASFGTASIYTSELFPTLIRSAVLGYENQAARVGGIIAPFIVMAGQASGSGNLIPFLTFGAASVLAGLLIFTLPETLGVPLPDTLQDMDNIASVFTHKTWQTGGLKAATKSMFKARVNFKRPAKPIKALLLPTLPETGSAAVHDGASSGTSLSIASKGGSARALLLEGNATSSAGASVTVGSSQLTAAGEV